MLHFAYYVKIPGQELGEYGPMLRIIMWSCCYCSFTKSCLTLCDRMDCNTPGFPVLHHLPEFAQTHVHWVDDAIQPSHSLLSPSPLAFNLSQNQGLFQWVASLPSGGQTIGASVSASGLSVNIQSWFPLGLTGLNSLLSKGVSRVFSNTRYSLICSFKRETVAVLSMNWYISHQRLVDG